MDLNTKAERSLITTYRKPIWNRFIGGIKDYQLIEPNDRIAVCISGGKDSILLAKCMQHLQKYSDFPFSVEFLSMDPGYRPENRALLQKNCDLLQIPVHIFETDIFNIVADEKQSPCYLCARMRRGYLYKNAQALHCNKIALGHHFDDVIETILMSLLYGAEMRTMMPKLHSQNFPGMELIRPLYLVHEEDIIRWKHYNGLEFLQCACRLTEREHMNPGSAGKRAKVKALIRELKKDNPQIDKNIFRSVHQVNLETLIGWRCGDDQHSFLDNYDRKENNEGGSHMSIKTIKADHAPGAVGPYSHAVLAGNTLYTSGQIGLIPESGAMTEGITAQTKQVLQNLQAVLKAADMTTDDVVKTTVFLTDLKNFETVNQLYGAVFTKKPARSCVEVAALPKGALVEIELIAAK